VTERRMPSADPPPEPRAPHDSAGHAGAPRAVASTRQPSELLLRWISAGILIPFVLGVSVWGGLALVLTVAAINLLAIRETYRLLAAHGVHASRVVGWPAVALLPFVVYRGDPSELALWVTAVMLAALCAELFAGRVEGAAANAAGTLFGIFYAGWLLGHLVALREIGGHPALAGQGLPADAGVFFVIATVVVTVGCDAGAFFVGRAFGRHKLAHVVSPGKSIEGAVGGLVAGVGLGLGCKWLFATEPFGAVGAMVSVPAMIVLTLIVGIASIVGDLAESLLKRDAHVKDAGHLVPGSGGVLDRVDSGLLAFPVMYYLVIAYYEVQ
jgi:phosphatidate cytidylyltransferase